MDIFLVRHAIAAPREGDWVDAERPLTKKGMARFSSVVTGLAALDIRFDRVFHSPWARAVQTAELLAPLGSDRPTMLTSLAEPPSRELLSQLGPGRIAVVGHEPWMGELLAWLVVGDRALGGHFPFKKGGVAWLDGEPIPGGCALRALWTPKSLRNLRGRRS